MSIEQEAAKDLSLGASEAEQVAGGKKSRKTAHKPSKAQKTYPVGFINVSRLDHGGPGRRLGHDRLGRRLRRPEHLSTSRDARGRARATRPRASPTGGGHARAGSYE